MKSLEAILNEILMMIYSEDTDKARVHITKYAKKYPQEVEFIYLRGFSFYIDEVYEKAVKYYQEVLEIDPEHYDALVNMALCYLEMKDIDNGLKYLLLASETEPDNPEAIFHLGLVHMELDKPQEASKYFLECIELGITEPDTWMFVADLYKEMGDEEKADQYMKEFKLKMSNFQSCIE